MSKNKDVISKQLHNLIDYFPEYQNDLMNLISSLDYDGYSYEIEYRIIHTLNDKIFYSFRNEYDTKKREISDAFKAASDYLSLANKVLYDKENKKYKIIPYELPNNSSALNNISLTIIDKYLKGASLIDVLKGCTKYYLTKTEEIKDDN